MSNIPSLDSVVQVPPIGRDGLLDYRWRRFFKDITGSVVPSGTGVVYDGSNTSYAQMTLYQGPDSAKGGSPSTGDIYYALDTGRIYWASSGTWKLLSEELTGDVTKPANSSITTLSTVNFTPGTYGSSTQVPIVTVDGKGRVLSIGLADIEAGTVTPGGSPGQLQFNDSGGFGGTSQILYNGGTGGLVFSNPSPTREALSPLLVKGDIFVRNATVSTRLPVGTDGQRLTADSAQATGLRWVSPTRLELRFSYGDATPKAIVQVPANKVVQYVSIVIIQDFNATSSLSIGDAGDPERLLATTDNLTQVAGTYATEPGTQYGVATDVKLYITPGASSQGSGLVTILFEE